MRVSAVAFLVVGSAAFNKHIGKEFARFAQRYATAGMSVLEVGGTDFNGTPRPMFESRGCKYTAMDIALGRGVDLVNVSGEPFPMADGSYDIVVTTSTFEHDPTFWMTMREIARVVRTGGIIFASAPSVGSYHAHPGDNWRFYRDAPAALAFWCGKELAMGGGPARSYPVDGGDRPVLFGRHVEEQLHDVEAYDHASFELHDGPAVRYRRREPRWGSSVGRVEGPRRQSEVTGTAAVHFNVNG